MAPEDISGLSGMRVPSAEQLADGASRMFIDVGLIYSKFMARLVESWLHGQVVLPSPISRRTENVFDLMHLAYEHWLGRGFLQTLQVAVELDRFYRRLRWQMVANRFDRAIADKLDQEVAREACDFLSQVRDVANANVERFREELEDVLVKLRYIRDGGSTG